ncbi:MAG: hypothetical protein AAF845_18035 [Bacteroidota bacterium]
MSRVLFGLAALALLIVVAPEAAAQPPPPDAPAAIPIDGGLGLLALAGGAYAAKRLRSKA